MALDADQPDPLIAEFEQAASYAAGDFAHLDIAQLREYMQRRSDALFGRFGEPGPQVASVTDHTIDVDGGTIPARVYRPTDASPLPAHLFLHGGGWCHGSIDEHVNDALCRERSAGANCVIVAVDYRLAPEHPFPVGLEDSYTALNWIVDHSAELGVDPGCVSIGGASAGANLAAAVSLLARDRGGPAIIFQLLEVPMLDFTFGMRGPVEIGGEAGEIMDYYLPDRSLVRDPLVSPLLAPRHAGLPATHVIVAEIDALCSQGEDYARRMASDGVDATCTRYDGAVHMTPYLTGVWEPARRWRGEIIERLHDAHAKVTA